MKNVGDEDTSGNEAGKGNWPLKFWDALRSIEYWALVVMGIGGAAAAPLWMVIGGALVLSLLTWPEPRWQKLMKRAHEVDAEWRQLAALAWSTEQPWMAVRYWLSARCVAVVIGTHVAHNLFFSALGYAAGVAAGWLWGIQ